MVVMAQLLNPKGNPEDMRHGDQIVELDVKLVRDMPFYFIEGGRFEFSLGRLHLKDTDWKTLFQAPGFATLKDGYTRAFEALLEENARDGSVKPASVAKVRKAVDALKRAKEDYICGTRRRTRTC